MGIFDDIKFLLARFAIIMVALIVCVVICINSVSNYVSSAAVSSTVLAVGGLFNVIAEDALTNITIEKAQNSTYTIYLDGQEVSKDAIDFNQYKISINDEKESIYLTKMAD